MKRNLYQFILLTLLLFSVSISRATAQIYFSTNEHVGFWDDDDSWFGFIPPTSSNFPLLYIEIKGSITSTDPLKFHGHGTHVNIKASDTLVVEGSLKLKNGARVSIGLGGVLVVKGDLTTQKNLIINNLGSVVVKGEFKIGKNSTVGNYGNIYLYDPSPVTNNSSLLGNSLKTNIELQAESPDLFSFAENGGVLPVELVHFEAHSEVRTIKLSWVTASEINNDKFEIYRSVNGEEFSLIGEIKGQGTTNETQNYVFIDKAPLHGKSYYRLKQIDFDGQFEYSPAVMVKIHLPDAGFEVFPTQLHQENIKFYARNLGEGKARLAVVALDGQIVFDEKVVLDPYTHQGIELKNTHNLQRGVYVVALFIGKNKYEQKIIVTQ